MFLPDGRKSPKIRGERKEVIPFVLTADKKHNSKHITLLTIDPDDIEF